MSKIALFIDTNYREGCGPFKVYKNLEKGLDLIGQNVLVNEFGEYTGCLHDNPKALSLPENTLMGPNLFVIPDDRPEYYHRYKNFIVPSEWVKPIYCNTPLFKNHNIFVWPVGIDTYAFYPNKKIFFDCLVYYKNRSQEDLLKTLEMLNNNNQTYVLIEYGRYTEDNFKKMLNCCRYSVLLTNTESQGIGYMEILASDTPCFVLNKPYFQRDTGPKYYATSVPYFDSRCGFISELSDDNCCHNFSDFLSNIPKYSPREYILEQHTLDLSAKVYLELLEKVS